MLWLAALLSRKHREDADLGVGVCACTVAKRKPRKCYFKMKVER